MARKVTISKDIILQAALNMLIREGYSSINIKTLAKEIGCSTQPIAWHFENMEGLRTALAEYAVSYAKNKMSTATANAVEAFEHTGRVYVEMAVHEPNLFRFLYLGENVSEKVNHFEAITTSRNNAEQIRRIADYLGISEKKVARYLQNTIIYAHGIATLVATNVISASEEEMMSMINRAAEGFLMQEEVPADKIPQKVEEEKCFQ